MSDSLTAALGIDFSAFEDSDQTTPSSAMVRGRDGRLHAVDVARLAWPDETSTAGVDYMADLSGFGRRNRC